MKTRNFILAGIIGGVVDWLLGFLFYGFAFADFFPQPKEGSNAMLFITLGCFTFGFFIAYIYTKWAKITTFVTGFKAGIIIGLFMGLISNFFNTAMQAELNYDRFALEIGISIVMAAIVGGVIGLVNGKIK